MQPERWTLEGFLDHFSQLQHRMHDRSIAWVLGAGASLASGIPLAGALAEVWLRELHRRQCEDDVPLHQWATAQNLGIEGYDHSQIASFYSQLYECRFRDDPEEGYAHLEQLMAQKDPSPGYSILAKILDETRHRVVVTTNFDNLVADALSIYTRTFPLMLGHEALAGFAKIRLRRPLICKIHRDLLLAPKNDRRSLMRLHESWAAMLRALFAHYTPIFIGYAGNDDSLMDLLNTLDTDAISGRLIWCYYRLQEPSSRICELVAYHSGALVPVPEFDLLMVLIGDKLGIKPLDETITERAEERQRQYRERLLKLDTTAHSKAAAVLGAAIERAGGAIVWLQKAKGEVVVDRREKILRQGIEQCSGRSDITSLQLEWAALCGKHYRHLDEAGTRLRELVSRHPENLDIACHNLLLMLVGQARCQDVQRMALQATLHFGSHPTLFFIHHRALLALEQYRDADLLYQRECHPTWPAYFHTGHALSLVNQGHIDAGLAHLHDLYDQAPHDRRWWLLAHIAVTAWVYKDQCAGIDQVVAGAQLQKIEDFDELLKTAILAIASNDNDKAWSTLQKASLLYPPNGRCDMEFWFLKDMLATLQGSNDVAFLERLRPLLENPERATVFLPTERRLLEKLLYTADDKLDHHDRELYKDIVAAIFDPAETTALTKHPRWQALKRR